MRHQIINPEVASEAEWFDGIVTLRDLEDLAGRLGVPLHVDAPEIAPAAAQRSGYDADALRVMIKVEEFAQRQRVRAADDGARRLQALREQLDAMEAGI